MPIYRVTAPHRSQYPQPLTFTQGQALSIGEKYQGPENWDNWYFCHLPDQPQQPGGWVPAQIIDFAQGKALQDFNARELDVDTGDKLQGGQILNGWAWCQRPADGHSGWVPLEHLAPADTSPDAAD